MASLLSKLREPIWASIHYSFAQVYLFPLNGDPVHTKDPWTRLYLTGKHNSINRKCAVRIWILWFQCAEVLQNKMRVRKTEVSTLKDSQTCKLADLNISLLFSLFLLPKNISWKLLNMVTDLYFKLQRNLLYAAFTGFSFKKLPCNKNGGRGGFLSFFHKVSYRKEHWKGLIRLKIAMWNFVSKQM